MQRYAYNGPVSEDVPIDPSQLKDKSVVFTGGANGIGEVCVREFVKAGAFVTFCDSDSKSGESLEAELNKTGNNCTFIQCDVRDWDQQKAMFDLAKAKSPHKSVDIVCANAGISRSSGDSLWVLDDPTKDPVKPSLNIVNVNLIGSMYTFKLAVHAFRQQAEDSSRDRCFIITGSMCAFIDSPAQYEYTATKAGLKGMMRTVRRNSHEQGMRIVYVAPAFTRSAIRTVEYEKWLTDKGVTFAEPEDVANCMLRIGSDKTINGRTFMVIPRAHNKAGFQDIDREDYKADRQEDDYLRQMQELQLVLIEDKWKDGEKVRDTGLLKK